MKIGIDIKAFKNGTTGIARHIKSMVSHMLEIDKKNEYYLFEPRSSNQIESNDQVHVVASNCRLPGTIWLETYVPYYIKRYNIDVFWAAEQICPLLFKGKTKIITTIYDFAYIHYPQTLQTTNYLIQKFLTPATMIRSDAVITISDYVRQEVLSFFGKYASHKVYSIPCGGPGWTTPANYNKKDRGNYLFFAGNFEQRKNIIAVIKALEILKQKGTSIPLYIAGPKGWKNSDIRSYLENSKIKNDVHHLGYISEEDLKYHYLHCRALVYPSLYEGFGLPVLEALSLDCPVITSKGTVMEEIGKDAVILADPRKPEEIAQAVQTIMTDKQRVEGLLRNKDAVLMKYTWAKSAEKLLNLAASL